DTHACHDQKQRIADFQRAPAWRRAECAGGDTERQYGQAQASQPSVEPKPAGDGNNNADEAERAGQQKPAVIEARGDRNQPACREPKACQYSIVELLRCA
ncbi:MAG: hypothetical protein PF501_11975, partial [Salinisphaera sp.]|nr:hypothetical protein [Salinisphaera sp.]